jgi:hypothetical protein
MEDAEVARTGVSRRRLNDHTLSGDQLSLRLCDFNHPFGDSVLHRPSRRHILDLSHCQMLGYLRHPKLMVKEEEWTYRDYTSAL